MRCTLLRCCSPRITLIQTCVGVSFPMWPSGTVFPSPLNLFHYFFLLIWSIIKAFLNCFGCRKKVCLPITPSHSPPLCNEPALRSNSTHLCRQRAVQEPEPAPERPESRASKRASAYQLTTSTDVVTVQMNEMEETEEFMLKVRQQYFEWMPYLTAAGKFAFTFSTGFLRLSAQVTASCILGYLRASFTTDDSEENHAEVVENLKAISRTVESQG